jgi:Ca-activated chloride channel homolog
MKSGETWYEVLEISNNATMEEIRLAYFELARLYHPDANPSQRAKEWFFQIQEAYEILSNPEKRKKYDDSIRNRKVIKEQVEISVKYSTQSLPRLNEPQLVYVLLELKNLVESEKIKIPQGHICLLVDQSTSMKGNRIEMVKENILQLIQQLKPTDVISIVTFNDKPEVLLTPTKAEEINSIRAKLDQIKCFGGTEIYKGLKAGSDLLWGSPAAGSLKQLLLLTDGHTYGDEEACFELAQKLQSRGIRLSTLGLGNEWNDVFLDRLAGITGGNSDFISQSEDLRKYVKNLTESLSLTSADGLIFDYRSDTGVSTNYIFRLQPEAASLPLEKPMALGEMLLNQKSIFLVSFTVNPIDENCKEVLLAKGKIRLEMISPVNQKMSVFVNLRLPVNGAEIKSTPPPEILEALSKISVYQMQEKATIDVKNGNLSQAIGRLGSISTQLFKQGNQEMALKVLKEAEMLKTERKYSTDGEKQLKYGTRALLTPESEKRAS